MSAPTRECAWAEPGRLLVGKYPGSELGDDAARAKLEALRAAGVTLFLDLTKEDDRLEPYAHLLDGAAHVRRPIRDMDVPSEDDLLETVALLERAVAAGEVVYVHCWGGCGRTGTVVAARWAAAGADPGEALARFHAVSRAYQWQPCPQTDAQLRLVHRVARRFAGAPRGNDRVTRPEEGTTMEERRNEGGAPSEVEELTGARPEESLADEPGTGQEDDGDDLWQQEERRRTPEQ